MQNPSHATRHPILDESLSYISVDVETSGPNPGQYSLLSIGACTLAEPRLTFYIELKPTSSNQIEEAVSITHLSLDQLTENGAPPHEAMASFEAWLHTTLPTTSPIFVAFNAPFDWMFINDYFHRFLGHNPFGHNALDIKAFYMGLKRVPWKQTSLRDASHHYLFPHTLTHHALQDAIDQAGIFNRMLDELKGDAG